MNAARIGWRKRESLWPFCLSGHLAMPVVLLSDARRRDHPNTEHIHVVPTEGHHQFYRGFTNPPCNEAHSRSGLHLRHIFMIYYQGGYNRIDNTWVSFLGSSEMR